MLRECRLNVRNQEHGCPETIDCVANWVPPGDEGIRRLRALLKVMLRSFVIRRAAVRPPEQKRTFSKEADRD